MMVLRFMRVDKHPADRVPNAALSLRCYIFGLCATGMGAVVVLVLLRVAAITSGVRLRTTATIVRGLCRHTCCGGHCAFLDIKDSCAKRLNRIEGQVRGLSRMVEEDRYCIDIVTQIAAVRAALRRLEEEILRDHVSHCVEHAIASGNKADQRRKIEELMAVVSRADR
jgi:DNA-binding FrmR family transcriptional regulator